MAKLKDPFTHIKYLLFQIFLLILFVAWLIRALRHELGF
jgi:flagellar biogenesis protein FliO